MSEKNERAALIVEDLEYVRANIDELISLTVKYPLECVFKSGRVVFTCGDDVILWIADRGKELHDLGKLADESLLKRMQTVTDAINIERTMDENQRLPVAPRIVWYARGGGLLRTGPFGSQADAAKSLILAKRSPYLPDVPLFPDDAFVWCEEVGE